LPTEEPDLVATAALPDSGQVLWSRLPACHEGRSNQRIWTNHGSHWSEAVARGGVEPPTFRFSDLGKTVQEHSQNPSVLAHDV
jgi:hypothetical protein